MIEKNSVTALTKLTLAEARDGLKAKRFSAAELTDAGDFLNLFRRTLAYQKLAAAAKRGGAPLPDERLKACFERLLALASCLSPVNPGAPFVLRALELDPVQIGAELVVVTRNFQSHGQRYMNDSMAILALFDERLAAQRLRPLLDGARNEPRLDTCAVPRLITDLQQQV